MNSSDNSNDGGNVDIMQEPDPFGQNNQENRYEDQQENDIRFTQNANGDEEAKEENNNFQNFQNDDGDQDQQEQQNIEN